MAALSGGGIKPLLFPQMSQEESRQKGLQTLFQRQGGVRNGRVKMEVSGQLAQQMVRPVTGLSGGEQPGLQLVCQMKVQRRRAHCKGVMVQR